jgi:alanyl-tRNA synthetase
LNANTIGFHIGNFSSTIDLDLSDISQDILDQVEHLANQIVWENHQVDIQFVDQNEISKQPFRKPPQLTGSVRVIKIRDIDITACGGTHVDSTGEIGMIKITNAETYKGGLRVGYLCGKRGLGEFQSLQRIIKFVSANLSIHHNDLPDTITRITKDNKYYKRAHEKSKNELMTYKVENLWKNTLENKGMKQIGKYFHNRSIKDLLLMAKVLREKPKTLSLLAGSSGDKIQVVCVLSSDIEGMDARDILKIVTDELGGKGGGSPTMAQGGIPFTNPEKVAQLIQQVIKSVT